GVGELIRNEVDGLLVPPSDQHALASAISRLIESPELRRRLSQSGREQVVANYNLRKNCRALAGVFRQRLGGGLVRPAVRQ
ncbi:MAG: glycosyltransferase family 4 protein, partial [bacterium]|nr:glycosyltransferase family 4 protein [bacterium]